ncbi:MAG: cbb3-type cytochrome c oxidase subunit 3 [Azoarcus sp.]|jgi:cytochrome c oxidase cbb3-type subunit 4|nr:cbb3-type cytochrome c oxidase subunit 3 [Azoarcus sp.]MDR1228625.1 cbb3-type cytochrome c oxidase subunit 3 [Azoarcus sp.]
MEEVVNNLRTIVIVLGLLCFVAICYWAYSKHAQAGFDEAARLPLADDDLPASPADKEGMTNG